VQQADALASVDVGTWTSPLGAPPSSFGVCEGQPAKVPMSTKWMRKARTLLTR
jgi:hypothetical protein